MMPDGNLALPKRMNGKYVSECKTFISHLKNSFKDSGLFKT